MQYLESRWKAIILLTFLTALIMTSCSSNGNGNSGTAVVGLSSLVVADHVSVVDAAPGAGAPMPMATGLKALLVGLMSSQLSAESDYMKDLTSVYVNERSTESFQTINSILCMVRQTRYDAMVNQGPYLALVDENACNSDKSNAATGGSQSTNTSSGANMPKYMAWITESIRTSSLLPQIVNFWIDSGESSGMIILARMTIAKGADQAPPYGIFRLDFQQMDPTTNQKSEKGVLVAEQDPLTGNAVLRFASNDPYLNNIDSATLEKSPDGTGHGTVLKSSSYSGTTDRFDIAYDDLHFRRHNIKESPDADICLDRNNFSESAWSYGLYNMDGSRFNLNSGFSIKIGQDFGWIGYWGLWLPAGVRLTTGEIVYQHDFGTNTDTPYTVFQYDGKLKRHKKNTLSLSAIKNIPLYWWDNNTGGQYTVIWDGGAFQKTAEQDPSGQWINCNDATAPCGSPDAIISLPLGTAGVWYLNLATLNSSDLYFWSQALSGQVRVPLGSLATTCTYTNNVTDCNAFNQLPPASKGATPVIFYTENIVYPGEAVPATLACFDNCPLSSSLTTSNPFRTDISSYQSGTTPDKAAYASYSFDSVNMVLTDGSGPISAATSTLDTNYQSGIMSGALFDPTQNLNALSCTWDSNSTCGWQAWNLDEFFTWETGPNSWNQLTVLQDGANQFVKFDPPLQVKYVHQLPKNPSPADVKYAGSTFYLEYNGFGNLSGIPGVCVDIDTGKVGVSCGPNTWWVPEFLIPATQADGSLTEVSYGGPNPKSLLVKPLQIEQRMVDAGIASCATLTTEAYPLSDMHEWREPAIGAQPTITTGPKVIGGVLQ